MLNRIQVLPDVSSIAFEWKRINDSRITGFVVYRKSGNGDFERIAILDNPLSTHFYDKDLKPESIYSYQFAVLGQDDTISPRSKTIRVKTSFIDPLENLYASSDEPRLVKLLWNPHPNPSIEKYIIERKIHNEWTKVGEAKNRLAVEYFDRQLLDGTTYEYRVAGVDFQGNQSRYSSVVKATTKFPPSVLKNIQASTDLPKLIVLRWDALPIKDLAGYIVYGSQNESKGYKKLAQTTKPYFEFKTEENAMQWFFKVVAIDQDGIQGKLDQDPVRGISLIPPKAPIIKGADLQDNEVIIGWEPPSHRVNEIIVYRKEGVFGKPLEFKLQPKATQFIDKEMQDGISYSYWVEFVDVNQIHSAPSQEFKFKKN